jgi:hypothetical protein
MDLHINIEISDNATPTDIQAAILAAARRAALHVAAHGVPEVDGDQVDVGAIAALGAVPLSFDAQLARSA